MPSKTSFFNGKVYRHTLSRFWLLSLAYPAVLVYQLLQSTSAGRFGYVLMSSARGDSLVRVVSQALTSSTSLVACAGVAMAVYGWMYRTRSVAFVTALPLRREEVFLSNMAAGLTLLLGGNALTVLLTAVLGAGSGNLLPGLVMWLGITSLLCVAYFGFASFCAVLTGSIVILPAVYAVLLYAAVALEATLRRIAQFLIFGLSGQRWKLTVLSPAYHLRNNYGTMVTYEWVLDRNGVETMGNLRFHGWWLAAGYAAAGVVFAVLAVLLLRKRRMESAGAVVAVPSLRKLFRWGAAAALALSAGLMTLQVIFGYSGYDSPGGNPGKIVLLLLLMLLGGFVGWFGSQGLMQKTVRVFDRGWGGFGIFCAVTCALVLGLELDVLGVERALPDMEQVAGAQIICHYSAINNIIFREPENIAAVMQLQRDVVANKKSFEQTGNITGSGGGALEIRYLDAEDNILMSRTYAAPGGEYAWASKGNALVSSGNSWGSKNPALAELQDVVNRREAVRSRVIPEFPVTEPGVAVEFAYAAQVVNGVQTGYVNLTQSEAMDVYLNCIVPDLEDTSLGCLRLLPEEGGSLLPSTLGLRMSFVYRKAFNESPQWHYLDLYSIPEDAYRTIGWLADHGLSLTGQGSDPALEEGEIIWEASVDTDPLEGVGAVLEKVYLEYDSATAGAMVTLGWTRMLLEAYVDHGEDIFRTYDQVRKFAHRYDVQANTFTDTLLRLRAAGEQLVDRDLGLVRNGAASQYTSQQVNDMFDAVFAGAGLA